jgi:hypothetical protein
VEKASLLGRFVAAEVLYDDSNEQGLDAWFPLTPDNSLRSMKADCKGKVMLLQALLRAQGIASAPVLLFRSDRYLAWPGPVSGTAINHVVLAVNLPVQTPPLPATLTEGPAKGWVLVDPTLETVGFGAPLPGFEGVDALFAGAEGDGRFVIHTKVPSVETTRVTLRASVDALGVAHCSLDAEDNGASALISRLVRTRDPEERRRKVLAWLSDVYRQPSLDSLNVTPPSGAPATLSHLHVSWTSNGAVEEMTSTVLTPDPCAAAALLAGLPDGLSPKRTVPPEDRVTLAPPWNTRLNAMGLAMVLDVKLVMNLPEGCAWSAPPPLDENRPYVTCTRRWTALPDGAFGLEVHLAIPRGLWAPEGRKERLGVMDRILMDLHRPLVLTRKS